MAGQVKKTCEGEIIMNIKNAAAARYLAGVAQLTSLPHLPLQAPVPEPFPAWQCCDVK